MDFYIPKTQIELSQRKKQDYDLYCKIIDEGRRNPVWFGEWAFGIKLFDYQAYEIMCAWTAKYVAWLNCRGAGKTTMLDIYSMLRLVLIPNYQIWVSCNSVAQGNQLFKSLEDIALRRNPHFKTLTDIFEDEIARTANSPTGFIHDPSGYKFTLYNNSGLAILTTNLMAIRGKRGSLISDESMGMTQERAAVVDLYATTDSDFGLGVGDQKYIEPKAFQLQMIYASSAGDVGTVWWTKYVQYSKRMIMGDPDYFVCDINANTVMNFSTVDGNKVKSHLTQSAIDKMVDEDPEKAEQELYNKFRKGGGKNAVIQADTLLKNSHVYLPAYNNDTGKRRFIFCYDPARANDNSILAVFEVIDDPNVGYRLRLVNMVSMVDQESRNKTPLIVPEQLKIIKQMMLDYNGDRAAEYENLLFYIDAGSGGGGITAVGDGLLADWEDDAGFVHKGIIDPVHPQYETSRKKYLNAMPIARLVEPRAYKTIMFDAFEKMTKLGLIDFPDYDGKDYLLLENEDGSVTEHKLTTNEMQSLIQCNLAKNEIIYIVRNESNSGSVQYALTPEKQNILNDDRAYCLSIAGYALSLMRRQDLNKVEKKSADIESIIALARRPSLGTE